VSGFLTGSGGDLSNGDFGAFAGEQNCGGTANPVTGAGDEGYLALRALASISPSRLQKFETAGGRRFGSDIVALSKAWENVMADTRPSDPALLGDAAKEPQRRS
jgi:hypothetical protein